MHNFKYLTSPPTLKGIFSMYDARHMLLSLQDFFSLCFSMKNAIMNFLKTLQYMHM